MVDLFVLAVVGILAVMAGFWAGRWSGQAVPLGEEGNPEEAEWSVEKREGRMEKVERGLEKAEGRVEKAERSVEGRLKTERRVERVKGSLERVRPEAEQENFHKRLGIGKKHSAREKKIPLGWAIGSPVSGMVSTFYEGSRRGALLLPDQGRVYAPASGKIIRLYPMGNRILLRTDSGVELLIQVGGEPDELCSRYFRPRVVQNEIVSKGKLLLEYDRERLTAEGADTKVSISVEEADNLRDITVTSVENVKAGEEILWVREYEYLT
ncbi:MAG: PTS glucose transporter subunit IIA [Candidatus Gastranaerophilales bacterium]|nr:PTS glucose transporter subunit IIA [Candidatus Gastranaerophilales bacterium]